MPIPKTRSELLDQLQSSFENLKVELDSAGVSAGKIICVDDWTTKDLLAVRAWWTEAVVAWIAAGQRGEAPVTPAEGFKWNETPSLNQAIIKKCRRESYRAVRGRLQSGYEEVLNVIRSLDDQELLDTGAFEWAGKHPISRWLSLNTVRQYVTARTYLRRALKNSANA